VRQIPMSTWASLVILLIELYLSTLASRIQRSLKQPSSCLLHSLPFSCSTSTSNNSVCPLSFRMAAESFFSSFFFQNSLSRKADWILSFPLIPCHLFCFLPFCSRSLIHCLVVFPFSPSRISSEYILPVSRFLVSLRLYPSLFYFDFLRVLGEEPRITFSLLFP